MDYNIQLDISSAKFVLENCNPTVIPLTVTVETAIRRINLPLLRKSGKLTKLIADQVKLQNDEYDNENKIGKVFEKVPSDILNFLHDPLACAVALGWNGVLVEEIPLRLEIINGDLHERIDPKGKLTKVVTKVDGDKFNQFWLNTMIK